MLPDLSNCKHILVNERVSKQDVTFRMDKTFLTAPIDIQPLWPESRYVTAWNETTHATRHGSVRVYTVMDTTRTTRHGSVWVYTVMDTTHATRHGSVWVYTVMDTTHATRHGSVWARDGHPSITHIFKVILFKNCIKNLSENLLKFP